MKSTMIKVLALLLTFAMLIPFSGCASSDEGEKDESKASNTNEIANGVARPHVQKTDYNGEFNILSCSNTFKEGYFFIESEEDITPGNDLEDRVYEREINVEEYLGVDIIHHEGGDYTKYTGPLKNSIQSNDDTYQMVLTHPYYEVASLITENMALDLNEFSDSLNLEADYWNANVMERLAINDSMYLGYNDMMLAYCYVIAFNKNMYANYEPVNGNLYTMVDNKEWTVEKLASTSALVTDDSTDTTTKKYGFTGMAWVPLVSFMTAADINVVEIDAETDLPYIAPMTTTNSEKTIALFNDLYELCNARTSYVWGPAGMKKPSTEIALYEDRSLFEIVSNYKLVDYKGEDVKFGVLPYPLYTSDQETYKTLSWNGMMLVPTTVKESNYKMVGDTIEMLAFYTSNATKEGADTVKTTFYERLLGSKVSNAPDDARMLDIIWDNQVTDIGLVYSSVSDKMDAILYAYPQLITAFDNTNIVSHFNTSLGPSETALQQMYSHN